MSTDDGPAVPRTGFYLDTSAVRALPDRERRLASAGAFTSIFTILELLDGSTDSPNQYRRRQAAVQRLLSSGMHIIPDMPQMSITRAFPELWRYYAWRYDDHVSILRLAKTMAETPDVATFAPILAADQQWQAISRSWADLGARTVGDSIMDQPKMWKLFEDASQEELRQLGIDPALSTKDRLARFIVSPVNIAASRYVVVLKALEGLGRSDDNVLGAQIDASYNGQGSPYLRVLAVGHLGRVLLRQTAAANDAYDRDHFAYIEPGVMLVTDDKNMGALAGFIGLRTTTSAEFAAAVDRATQG